MFFFVVDKGTQEPNVYRIKGILATPPKLPPPGNTGLSFGLIKGNQWLINPKNKAGYFLGGVAFGGGVARIPLIEEPLGPIRSFPMKDSDLSENIAKTHTQPLTGYKNMFFSLCCRNPCNFKANPCRVFLCVLQG